MQQLYQLKKNKIFIEVGIAGIYLEISMSYPQKYHYFIML